MQHPSPACFDCKHFIGPLENGSGICKAFEDGIPKDIYFHAEPHDKPRKGDNGLVFTPISVQ